MLIALTLAALLAAQQVENPPAPPVPQAAPQTAETPAAAQPEGFAAVKWGASQADVKAAFPKARCRKLRTRKNEPTKEQCEVRGYKIGDTDTGVRFIFLNDAFYAVGVFFPSTAYGAMKDLLFEKYGADVKVETDRAQESETSRILDSVITGSDTDRPLEVYEITKTSWSWPDVTVTLFDQRMHSLWKEYSKFELVYLTDEEKQKRKQAREAF